MSEAQAIFDALSRFGGLLVLAGALLTGMVMTKQAVEGILKERDKADALRDARLEDQKSLNKELIQTVKDTADALKRLADLEEARTRAEAERRGRNV